MKKLTGTAFCIALALFTADCGRIKQYGAPAGSRLYLELDMSEKMQKNCFGNAG